MSDRGSEPVSVIQIGIGGMGHHYLSELLSDSAPEHVSVRAAIDPFPDKEGMIQELNRRDIPVFPKLEDVFSAGLRADLVIVSSPLQHHVRQSLEALRAGCFVLCEKPLAATVQDADVLIKEAQKSNRWVRIGYQWSYTASIQALKRDILDGRFGTSIRAKSLFLWPREISYYRRNDWAGRIKDSQGRWVLDSPAASAMAHDLHNLLFLLGRKPDRSARPKEVQAELYRANPIENYDTLACRILTADNVEILFYASHAVRDVRGPFFEMEFEKASVSFGEKERGITARLNSGEEINYGSPQDENPFQKLHESLAAVRKSLPVVCGPEAARPQTLCVNGIQESQKTVRPFRPPLLRRNKQQFWVDGLSEALEACWEKGALPAEEGFSWANSGQKLSLEKYVHFPGGRPPLAAGEEAG